MASPFTTIEQVLGGPAVQRVVRGILSAFTVQDNAVPGGHRLAIDTRSAGITTTFSAGRSGGSSGGARTEESKLAYDELMAFQGEAEGLRTGLASGVKPVPVNIPEQGELLTLSGALPPSSVSVTLDVKPD